jgi:hypothetical protein
MSRQTVHCHLSLLRQPGDLVVPNVLKGPPVRGRDRLMGGRKFCCERWDLLGAGGGRRVIGPLAEGVVMGDFAFARPAKHLHKFLVGFERALYQLSMFDWLRYRHKLARLQLAHRKEGIRLEEKYQRATMAATRRKR